MFDYNILSMRNSKWNKYEAAILLEAYKRVESGGTSKNKWQRKYQND